MDIDVKKICKLGIYLEDFKRSVVKLFESGELSILQLEKLYGISNASIYNWVYKFPIFNKKRNRIIEMTESSQSKLAQLSKKVKELEQIVDQKTNNH